MDLTVNSKDFGNDLARLNMLYNTYGVIQEKKSQPTTKTAKQNALALFGEAKKHKAVVAKKSIFGNKYNCQKDDSDIIAKNLFGFSDVVAFDMIKENGVFVSQGSKSCRIYRKDSQADVSTLCKKRHCVFLQV